MKVKKKFMRKFRIIFIKIINQFYLKSSILISLFTIKHNSFEANYQILMLDKNFICLKIYILLYTKNKTEIIQMKFQMRFKFNKDKYSKNVKS